MGNLISTAVASVTTDLPLPVSDKPIQVDGGVLEAAWRREISRTRQHVLVVDDAPDIAQLLATFLRAIGYDVTTSYSATEALDEAARQHFDVVVSDIGMPLMNGYELAGALRGTTTYGRVPLIAVTGFDEYDDLDRSRRAGFDAHLKKPFDLTNLADTLERLLRH